jgi:hypothetical protein
VWEALLGWLKGLFGGKSGGIQIGTGNQSNTSTATSTTAGNNSPVYNASVINITHPPPAATPELEADPFAAFDPLTKRFLADLSDTFAAFPLMRDFVVLGTSTTEYTWPGPHLRFSEDEQPGTRQFVGILCSHGLVRETKGDFSYRFSEKLVDQLSKNRERLHTETGTPIPDVAAQSRETLVALFPLLTKLRDSLKAYFAHFERPDAPPKAQQYQTVKESHQEVREFIQMHRVLLPPAIFERVDSLLTSFRQTLREHETSRVRAAHIKDKENMPDALIQYPAKAQDDLQALEPALGGVLEIIQTHLGIR